MSKTTAPTRIYVRSPETRQKMSKAKLGKRHSRAHNVAISKAMKKLVKNGWRPANCRPADRGLSS